MPRPSKASDNGIEVKKGAKQGEFEGMEVSSRKIAELEELGDAVIDAEDAYKSAKGHLDDAQENLVAAMRRRNRSFYNRPTWGTITLKEPTIKAKVKKGQHGMDDDTHEDEQFAEKVTDFIAEQSPDAEIVSI